MILIYLYLHETFTPKNSEILQNEILQVYGVSYVIFFQNMNKIGLPMIKN
jgi:hypothetical protein